MSDEISMAASPVRRRRPVELLLVLAVLAIAAPFLREWTAQPASRFLVAVAVVDQGTLNLDSYRESLGLDLAVIDGSAYSDKAPYQPLASVPVYWTYRAAGGSAFPVQTPGAEVGSQGDAGLWWVTLWSATIPAALLIVLMFRHAAAVAPRLAAGAALALSMGTVLLPFSSMLFGHMLAAVVGFGAWYLLRREDVSSVAAVGAGALLGIGVGIEYPQVLLVIVLGVFSVIKLRARAVWVGLGGAIALAPLLVFNALTFGGPFRTAYQGYLPNFEGDGAFGVYNLQAPDLRQFGLALFGDRGLLALTPIMLIAVVGCVLAIRARGSSRPDAIVALVLLFAFLLVSTGVDGYGGSVPGPRYLVPVIPFFVRPLAVAWGRWRLISVVAAVWSALWMVLATLTDPLYSDGGHARADWLANLFDGSFERSIPGQILGDSAILAMVAVAGGCALLAVRLGRRLPDAAPD